MTLEASRTPKVQVIQYDGTNAEDIQAVDQGGLRLLHDVQFNELWVHIPSEDRLFVANPNTWFVFEPHFPEGSVRYRLKEVIRDELFHLYYTLETS